MYQQKFLDICRMYSKFTVFFCLIALPLLIQPYHLDCPSFAQWKLRGFGFCNNSSDYTCLLNTNENKYNEHCGLGLHFLVAGYKFVISGSLDRQQCRSKRFQPFTLPSNISSSCVLLKSECNEDGQIIFSEGTTTYDRSCRCNYIKNYAFVTKPKSSCYCLPSQEDCSCYKKKCPIDHYLSPDYQCVHFSKLTGIFQCPEIHKKKIQQCVDTTEELLTMKSTQDMNSSMNILVIHVVAMILVIVLCVGFFVLGKYFQHDQELFKQNLLEEIEILKLKRACAQLMIKFEDKYVQRKSSLLYVKVEVQDASIQCMVAFEMTRDESVQCESELLQDSLIQ
ncbi:uncharacterized protein LOC143082635 [Mytilus galloprovincialis]|uniref:uncharacterized protein LOC143082635 n=1 Tax=Mytilus galloprovincialis TaxID=29158 RepID=UPI003F7C7956